MSTDERLENSKIRRTSADHRESVDSDSQQAMAGSSEQKKADNQDRPFAELRRLLAEMIGTFSLTLVAAGGEVISVLSNGEIGYAARVVAPGLLIMAMIYSLGPISGAHFNPVVTLAFAIRRDFQWRRVPGYWIAQFAGAILAAFLLLLLFGSISHLGANQAHHGTLPALVIEVILTFFLITVILATATNQRIVGHNAAIAVSATIVLDGLFSYPISGASMNPARSLGPALVSGYFTNIWIYMVGPLVGTLLAVGVAWLLRGGTTPEAVEAAGGK